MLSRKKKPQINDRAESEDIVCIKQEEGVHSCVEHVDTAQREEPQHSNENKTYEANVGNLPVLYCKGMPKQIAQELFKVVSAEQQEKGMSFSMWTKLLRQFGPLGGGTKYTPQIYANGQNFRLHGINSGILFYQVVAIGRMRAIERKHIRGVQLALRSTENAPPPVKGGILSFEMGLGKSCMMIVNIVNDYHWRRIDAKRKKLRTIPHPRTTVIVAPSVEHCRQWETEIKKHVDMRRIPLRIAVCVPGNDQTLGEDSEKPFAKKDIVLTTPGEIVSRTPKGTFQSKKNKVDDVAASTSNFSKRAKYSKTPIFHNYKFRRIVVDEGHNMRNMTSQLFQAINTMDADFTWAITGTPLQNSLEEANAYLQFTKHPAVKECPNFAKQFLQGPKGKQIAGPELRKIAKEVFISGSKEDTIFNQPFLKLPRLTIRAEKLRPTELEALIYQHFMSEAQEIGKKFLKSNNAKAGGASDRQFFGYFTHLRQISSAIWTFRLKIPKILSDEQLESFIEECLDYEGADNSYEVIYKTLELVKKWPSILGLVDEDPISGSNPIATGKKRAKVIPKAEDTLICWKSHGGPILCGTKIRAAISQVKTWLDEDKTQKILIFAEFRETVETLAGVFDKNGWGHAYYYGDCNAEEKSNGIKSFREKEECRILILSLKLGSYGLNLQGANKVLLVDQWWNRVPERQAIARAHRYGQTREVEAVRQHLEGTIDDKLEAVAERKFTTLHVLTPVGSDRPFNEGFFSYIMGTDVQLPRGRSGAAAEIPGEEPLFIEEEESTWLAEDNKFDGLATNGDADSESSLSDVSDAEMSNPIPSAENKDGDSGSGIGDSDDAYSDPDDAADSDYEPSTKRRRVAPATHIRKPAAPATVPQIRKVSSPPAAKAPSPTALPSADVDSEPEREPERESERETEREPERIPTPKSTIRGPSQCQASESSDSESDDNKNAQLNEAAVEANQQRATNKAPFVTPEVETPSPPIEEDIFGDEDEEVAALMLQLTQAKERAASRKRLRAGASQPTQMPTPPSL